MYLLDTNICVYTINHRPGHVVAKVRRFAPPQIKLSSISVGELQYGVAKSAHRERNAMALIDFLSGFEILDFDARDAEIFGMIRASLEKEGQSIGPYDLLIAAQALARDLVLVTNNLKEFQKVPELRLENWAVS